MAWYECKVSYPRDLGNGLEKRVTETYLVDAVSYTEVEARITDTLRPCVPGGFSVSGIRRSGYAEVFADGEGDWFYNVRILFFTLDEKSGAENIPPGGCWCVLRRWARRWSVSAGRWKERCWITRLWGLKRPL